MSNVLNESFDVWINELYSIEVIMSDFDEEIEGKVWEVFWMTFTNELLDLLQKYIDFRIAIDITVA